MTRTLNQDCNQWLENSKETSQDQGYNHEFIGVTYIQLKVEVTKPSLVFNTNLPNDLKGKIKAILYIKCYIYNCVRLFINAVIYPLDKIN